MKKLLLLIGLLFLLSCEKDTYCWECTTVTTYSATWYVPIVEEIKTDYCDKSPAEIQEIEKDNSCVVVIKIGTTTAITEKITTCKQQ